jgi:diaminohydroxyphosphoribosylaminopyrimidine deaminase/5-amino-6-(5-phosphoribosylamino)uracil reductase
MINSQSSDSYFMKRALELAEKGRGSTLPNPMVGAIIVKDGQVIGEGYHTKYGEAHAEVEALKSSTEDVTRATIYVNLEPCSHQGKTGPCTNALIKSGIKKVVIGTLDPNKKVSGEGAKLLEEAGITVKVGVLKKECKALNEIFFGFQRNGRPFVALKFASSLDGKIATKTGDSRGITGIEAVDYSYNLRREYQAILVGINTVLNDDPNLGAHGKGDDPLRIILDSHLKILEKNQVLRDSNALVVTSDKADGKKLELLKSKGVNVLIASGKDIFSELFKYLEGKNIISILVEGGGTVLASFVRDNLFDKLYGFYAPIFIGGNEAVTSVEGAGVNLVSESHKLRIDSIEKLGDDFLVTAYPKNEI